MTKRTDGCDEIIAIIKKFKINKRVLSTTLGIDNGVFSEKINLKRGNKFTPSQKEELTAVIKNMGVELSGLEK